MRSSSSQRDVRTWMRNARPSSCTFSGDDVRLDVLADRVGQDARPGRARRGCDLRSALVLRVDHRALGPLLLRVVGAQLPVARTALRLAATYASYVPWRSRCSWVRLVKTAMS